MTDIQSTRIVVGMLVRLSTIQTTFYIILLIIGILGNTMIISVIVKGVIRDQGGGRSSDIILMNLALSNLMVSITRNSLQVISDLGLELYSSRTSCQFLMGLFVWLRSVNVWSIFFLSAFQFQTLRRITPISINRGPSKFILFIIGVIWIMDLLYAIPGFIFAAGGNRNSTETLMLVSLTTRPLLGCVWKFPSTYSGLVYATISMVIHETLPIILMNITNLGSLQTLYTHGRSLLLSHKNAEAPPLRRISAERHAAKVILTLNMLFVSCWVTSMISANYFNYNRASSKEFLLVVTRFSNTTFIALSPIVLAIGHKRIRSFLKALLIP